jgi:hypothetical protein
MIFKFKCLFFLLILLSSTNVNCTNLKLNYNKYIKHYYHIHSHSSIEECMKSNFYKYVYNYPNNSNENINEFVYKNKLEKIIDFL